MAQQFPHKLEHLSAIRRTAPRCLVLGGGSHAKVVIEAMQVSGESPCGVLDADRSRWHDSIFGVSILGGDDLLPELLASGLEYFTVGVGSTGNTSARRALFERGKRIGLTPRSVQHSAAICSASATIEEGAQILAGAIVGTCASIGANAIVNTGAIVEHDCVIGAHAHISPGVRLAGNVCIGENAHIGIGATVRQGITIGARSVVGAGSVIVDDIPADVLVIGVPGRIHKRLAA